MDKIPFEVSSMIAYYVSQPPEEASYALQQWLKEHPKISSRPKGVRQLKTLRLVNKAFSVAAVPYLFVECHVINLRKSFKRLNSLSRHNACSKQVRSLVYEPASLEMYRSLESWERSSPRARELLDVMRAGAPEDLTLEEATEWLKKDAPQSYLDKCDEAMSQTRSAYERYQGYLQDQNHSSRFRHNEQLLKSAIPWLSRLERVTLRCLSVGCWDTSSTVHHALETWWNPLHYGDDEDDLNLGVTELCSIFDALFVAAKIKTLECFQVSWIILDAPEPELRRMRWTFQWLHDLELDFFAPENGEPLGYLATENLGKLLTAAPELRRLSVSFPCHVSETAALQHVVGDMYWPFLEEIKIGGIAIGEELLTPFLRKHATTLHTVSLGNTHLLRGNWMTILDCFRSTLALREFHSFGVWSIEEPFGRCWNVDYYQFEDDDEPQVSDSHDVAMAIRSYVLYGADFNLDEISPQIRYRRR